MSASSSITLATGLPAPCPAFVSTRIRIGPPSRRRGLQPRRELLRHAGRHAVVGVGGRDQHRRIDRAVATLWYGEYASRYANCAGSSADPYSEIQNRPTVNRW